MTEQTSSNTSGSQPYSKQNTPSQNQPSANANNSQILQAYSNNSSNAQTGSANTSQPSNTAQQQSAANTSKQQNQAQAMAGETGLEYTANDIRKEKLKSKNQKAADSLVDRMYWQHEESLSKSISVNDKGELENYDDTPGFGSDKPGL